MDEVKEIKKRLNIVEIVGNYLKLNKTGTNYKALCPFHNEKTPSFTINEDRQVFHCFGCGKGGDIFTFIQEIEGLNFKEALRLLADRANVPLSFQKITATSYLKDSKNRAKEVLRDALLFFKKNLKSPLGKDALLYLKERGVKDESIDKFQLGFSLLGWSTLLDFLKKRGFQERDLLASGLIKENEKVRGRFYDRFRGRIMFPIFNSFSEVIGFSGRVLPGADENKGKYINTPQTEIYNKSEAIYGIHLAKQTIKKEDVAILLEGNLDVVMSAQAGVLNAVAVCGTATTQEQLTILKRYSNNIALSFDADEAGIKAMEKTIVLALKLGLNVGVIDLSKTVKGVKDVSDLVFLDEQLWVKKSHQIKPAMEYYLNFFLKKDSQDNLYLKKEKINQMLDKIALLPDQVEQAFYLKKMTERSGIKIEVLYDILKAKSKTEGFAWNDQNQTMDDPQNIQPKEDQKLNSLYSKDVAIEKVLNRMIGVVAFFKDAVSTTKEQEVLKELEQLDGWYDDKEVLTLFLKNRKKVKKINDYLNFIEDEKLKNRVARLFMVAENHFTRYNRENSLDFPAREEFEVCLNRLKQLKIREKASILLAKIKRAEKNQNVQDLKKLLYSYKKLVNQK